MVRVLAVILLFGMGLAQGGCSVYGYAKGRSMDKKYRKINAQAIVNEPPGSEIRFAESEDSAAIRHEGRFLRTVSLSRDDYNKHYSAIRGLAARDVCVAHPGDSVDVRLEDGQVVSGILLGYDLRPCRRSGTNMAPISTLEIGGFLIQSGIQDSVFVPFLSTRTISLADSVCSMYSIRQALLADQLPWMTQVEFEDGGETRLLDVNVMKRAEIRYKDRHMRYRLAAGGLVLDVLLIILFSNMDLGLDFYGADFGSE